jgi:hypothetical protein
MICRECGRSDVEFKKHNDHKNKGICLKCHNEYNKNYQAMRAANKFPDRFFQCDDCDKIFSIYENSGFSPYRSRIMRTKCPYCDSEEILTLKEQQGEK